MQQRTPLSKRLIPGAILLLVIALLIYIFFASHHIPSTMPTDDYTTHSLFDTATFDSTSGNIEFSVDTNLLNNYLADKSSTVSIYSNSDLSVDTIFFDAETSRVGFTLLKDNSSPVYIEGTYDASLHGDYLSFSLTKDTVGSLPGFISTLFQNDYQSLRLDIPIAPLLSPFDRIYLDHMPSTLPLIFNEGRLSQNEQLSGYIPPTSPQWLRITDTLIDMSALYPYDAREASSVSTESSLRTMHISQLTYMLETLYASHLVDDFTEFNWQIQPVTNPDQRSYALLLSDTRTSYQTVINVLFDTNGHVSNVAYPIDRDANDDNNSVLNQTTALYLKETLNDRLQTFSNSQVDSLSITDSSLQPTTGDIQLTVQPDTWTILVYMIGSDLESGYNFYTNTISGNASKDLREMMAASYNPNVQIVVQTGGTTHWDIDTINPLINQRFLVKNGELIPLKDLKLLNMVRSQTLSDFALWGIDAYPSDHVALILWDHGGGSLYGFGVDEYYPNDSFTLDELARSLQVITDSYGKSLEVVGFDACLMATLETANIVSPYVNYLIASEDTEPESGWEYTRLLKLIDRYPVSSGETFGSFVIESFYDSFSDDSINHRVLTLSVIDLNLVSPIVEAMNNILPEIDYATMTQLIPSLKAIGGTSLDNGYTDHFDLYEFSRSLPKRLSKEAAQLESALNEAIVYHAEGVLTIQAKGLSFYLPYYDIRYPYHIKSYYTPVTFSDTYLEYLSGFLDYKALVTSDNTDIPFTIQDSNRPYTLTIPDDYVTQVADVYLGISYIDHRLDYDRTVDLGYDALAYPLSQSGMYEENFGLWPSIGVQPIPVYLTHNGTESINYETPILLNGESATMMLAYIYATDTYEIAGIRKSSTDGNKNDPGNSIIDRKTLSLNPGDQIDILYDIYDPEDKRWYDETLYSFIIDDKGTLPIIDNYQIQRDDFKDYRMQFVVKDTHGTLYYSQLLHPLR